MANRMHLSGGRKKALLALIACAVVVYALWDPGRDPYQAPQSLAPKVELDPGYERKLFASEVKAMKADGVIVGVSKGLSDIEVRITVNQYWHILDYEVRLKLAQNLWKMWAKLLPPGDRNQVRITIADQTGNKVGGSRLLGPSRIWVRDK